MSERTGTWPRVAIVGAGAVGSYFGAMLARAGAPVTLIARPAHVDAVAREGLLLEGVRIHERVPMAASTEIHAARESEIALICVKTVDTEAAARALQPHLAPGAVVLSLQNGVDNVERMWSAARIAALPAVVYVAVAMIAPGHVRHSGRGDLIIGQLSRRDTADLPGANAPSGAGTVSLATGDANLPALARLFERADIPCRVSPDVRTELWTKMTLNCAYNAISALGRSRYGRMIATTPIRELMERVVAETVAVARAEGVALAESEMIEATWRLGEAMPAALSSTAQDINRAKATEIDSLNGYIVRRGQAHGVQTPVNQALYTLVKLLEQSGREELQ